MNFYRSPSLCYDIPSIRYRLVYILALIFTFHTLIVSFSSSTYLEQFIPSTYVGLIFALGSLGSMLAFLFLPRILSVYGNTTTTLVTMGMVIIALLIIGFSSYGPFVLLAFLLFLILNPLGYFAIDVYSETLIGENESDTGKKRGLVLGLMSLSALMAPLLIGVITGPAENLERLFFVAAGAGIIFMLVIIAFFRQFYDPSYTTLSVTHLWQSLTINRDISLVMYAHFLLQLFFSWAIIYIPLYLATEIGYSWSVIGSIIAVGLLAYVLFEFPAGYLADRYWGEKEMMAIGFLVLALTIAGISFIHVLGIAGWMTLMFVNRAGASLVEATTESYFFKKVQGRDSSLMSIFRLLRPAANVAGAMLGTLTLLFIPFQYIFLVLALLILTGLFAALEITDTK